MLFLLSGFFKCSFVWFIFYYYFLDACLFPNERQIKAMDFCGWEGSGIREEMRAIINIYCVKNSIINKIIIIITDKTPQATDKQSKNFCVVYCLSKENKNAYITSCHIILVLLVFTV